jgi:hypothetical protein
MRRAFVSQHKSSQDSKARVSGLFGVFTVAVEMTLRKLLVCAALLCVAFARASAQDGGESKVTTPSMPSFVRLGDVSAEAARLLKSDESKERAWGAYLSGLHGLKEHAPLLVSMLEDERPNSGYWQEAFVRHAALDALIRLDAEVPAESLLPLYGSEPDEVLILLAREPEKNQQALLGLFDDDTPDARWLALGNMLAAQGTHGFAARLLGGLKIEASVYLYDREGDHNIGGGSNGGCGCGVGGSRDRSLPPVVYYHLTTGARPGATVFVTGRQNVYYERTPWAAYCDVSWLALERDHVRVDYLADMLGTTGEDLGLDARPFREVVCKDSAQCRKALAGVRDEIQRAYSSTLSRLLERGLLDAAEVAELKPDITLNLNDYRDKKTFPLPDKLKGVKLSVNTNDEADTEVPDAADPQPVVYDPPIIPPP